MSTQSSPDLPEDKVRCAHEETNVLIEEVSGSPADGPGWPPSPVGWFRMLAKELHWSFVFGVVATYGVSQGLGGGITRVASDYYWKDVQRVQPSAAQVYQGVTSIPWMIKPLWGLLTDVLPVAGYRRRPYFVLAGIMGVIATLIISIHSKLHVLFALLALMAGSASVAIADVTIDACVAENSIMYPHLAADMMSLNGFCASVGGLIGFSISGFLVHAIGSQGALGMITIPSALVILAGMLLKEVHIPNFPYEQAHKKFVEASGKMLMTLKCPEVWRPCVYMYMSLVLSVDIQEGMFYWYTDRSAGPSFSEGFIGFIFSIGSVGSLVGVILYQNILKDHSFHSVLFSSQLLLSLSGMLDLILVLRLNLQLGIPDYYFAVIDEGVSKMINRIKWMPLLVLSSKLCPPGIEGTFFALLMSIDNIGLLTGSWAGGLLLHLLKITRTEFQNLWAAIIIRRNPRTLNPMAPSSSAPAFAARVLRRLLSTAAEAARPVAKEATKGVRPLYRRLSELGNAEAGSVSRVLNKWVREGGEARAVDLAKYVRELRKYKRHAQALELMDWMVHTKGMNMSHTNHAIRLDLIYKVRGIEAAENYFAGLPDPAKNHRTHGALLNCYCSAKMEEKATDLYRKMDELGISSSTLPINNLMSLYMKLGQHKKVVGLFEEMKVKNIKPDNLTCCILMTSYAALNKIDSVEEVLKEMKEKDVVLGWSAYSTLASIYVSAGLVEKAESALKKLEGLVVVRDGKQPFDFLMSLYASVGNLSEVDRVWDVVKATFSKVTNTSYLSMLHALYKLNDVDRMKQIYEDWESNYEIYDVKLTNMMTRAHLKSGMTKEAELLWEKAKEKGAHFDSKTCELFLDHCMGAGDMKSALNWVENMTKLPKKAGKLDREKINKFLKYFEEHKDVEGAERLCNCLRTLGCIDGKAYESLVRTYLAAGKTNRSLRQQIKEDKIEICYDIGKLLKRMGDKGR